MATGDEGKIYKSTPAGKVTVAFDSQESQVLCLALAPDGSIYAGTGPSGLIVRLAPDGNSRVICDTPENYVWSLAFSVDGKTLASGSGDGTVRLWDTEPVAARYLALRKAEAGTPVPPK